MLPGGREAVLQNIRQPRATPEDLAYARAQAALAFSKALGQSKRRASRRPSQYLQRLNPVAAGSDGRLVLAFGSRSDAP